MNGEYREAILYDAETNSTFREAMVDLLITPACVAALERNKDKSGSSIFVDEEIKYEDSRAKYDFCVKEGEHTVTVGVTVLVGTDELSAEALKLLCDEIKLSDLSDDIRVRFMTPEELARAVTELFTQYKFIINLSTSNVTVHSGMGFAIDGHEIRSEREDRMPLPELDQERQALFESRELVELIRALYIMDLVTQDDVRQFLEAF